MSWPCVAAAWRLDLPPIQKYTLLALSDQADASGRVSASHRLLVRLTGLSEQTIRRTLRELAAVGRVSGAAGSGRQVGSYQLHLWGVTESGVPESQGCQIANRGVPNDGFSSDPLLIPKSRKAEAARRLETPTRKQVAKLVHVLVDDPAVEIRDDIDLRELLKSHCAHAGFAYDNDIVNAGISDALRARGQNPLHPLDVQRLRRRR